MAHSERLTLLALILFGLVSPAAGEVWFHEIREKEIAPCSKLPGMDMDQLWTQIEGELGLSVELDRESGLSQGVVFQEATRGLEFNFYRTKESCEYQRREFQAFFKGGVAELEKLQESVLRSEWLEAMVPQAVPADEKETWINSFGGCTDGVLRSSDEMRGALETTLSFCECTADLSSKGNRAESLRDAELQEFALSVAESCLESP